MKLARLCACACFIALAASCTPPASGPQDDPNVSREELLRLSGTWQGTWRVVSLKRAGVEQISPHDEPKFVTYAPDRKVTIKWQGVTAKAEIVRLDPSKQPKEIDYLGGVGCGPYEGKLDKSIYKLEGDTYTECSAEPGEPRPTEFKSTKENGWYLSVYKLVGKVDR
jgi:uncharacterized protein (TIGR03067 family)